MEFWNYLLAELLRGTQTTVVLFLACAVAGNALAVPVALAAASEHRLLRAPIRGLMLMFRGTPLLVQLYIVYFGIGQLLGSIPSIRYSALWPYLRDANGYAFVTLSLNTAAYCGEIWRGAIRSVPKGQTEAGQSLGLSDFRVTLSIILPQALRIALPALGGQNILLLKGTALASTITVFEVMGASSMVRGQTFRVYEPLLAAAAVYFLLASCLELMFRKLERRLALK